MKFNALRVACAASVLTFATFATVQPSLADDLDSIREDGVFSAAMSGQYPPFSMVDEQNNTVGFDVDIANEIARRLGVKTQIVTTAWDGIIPGLLARKYDAIVGSMTITPERQKAVDFVGPYYHDGRGIFVPQGAKTQSLADLKGLRVGVTLGETHQKWADQHADWKVRTYKGLPELIMELKSGRLDAVVVDSVAMLVAIKETGAPIRKLDLPDMDGGSDEIGIAIRKGNPELKAAMQGALDAMMADGTYEKIAMKWIGKDIR